MAQESKSKDNKWLEGFYDPLAGLKSYSCQLQTADIAGDGDFRLLACNETAEMKVFRSTELSQSIRLARPNPSGVAVFFSDDREPRTPGLAVASGPTVFIYRNLRPYFKYTLPRLPIDSKEEGVWEAMRTNELDITEGWNRLSEARDEGAELSVMSVEFLALEDPEDQRAYVQENVNTPLERTTVISCLTTLFKKFDDPGSVSYLVLGTENKEVVILQQEANNIMTRIKLPSVPTSIVSVGIHDVEYRLFCLCRDGKVYCIRNGMLSPTVFELESPIVAMTAIARVVLVAGMDSTVHAFHHKGKRVWSLLLPSPVLSMCPAKIDEINTITGFIVAMENGEVRLYNQKALIVTTGTGDGVEKINGVYFGPYGRESHCLITTSVSGALHVRILGRKTNFSIQPDSGPPPEQDIPLPIPKKTRLYVEQTQREREQGTVMHRVFQRDLCRLRLETARAYVSLISHGRGPQSVVGGANVRINASVIGIGPKFKLRTQLHNSGSKATRPLSLVVSYDSLLYSVPLPQRLVPVLLPQQTFKYETEINSIDPEGRAAPVRVTLISGESSVPVLSAVVDMPMSWTEEGQL